LHPIASRVAQEEMRKLPYVDCVAEKGFRPAELAAEVQAEVENEVGQIMRQVESAL
jgi:hypothetical protein